MRARRALSEFRAPRERDAAQRAWQVVRAAAPDSLPPPRRPRRWRGVTLSGVVVLVGGLTLTPAGATVTRWISHTIGIAHSAPALFSLPAPGRVLVSGAGGTWTVARDGSARRLGPWRQASWSPHGEYIAVAAANTLAAVDPRGTIRWTLHRPAVSDPSWFSPSGYRVAYLSATNLRVVAGDGTGDRLIATGVAAVAPTWRPDHPYQLAYIQRGTLIVRDSDTGSILWTAQVAGVRKLAWSADGQRLLALAAGRASVYRPDGRLIAAIPGSAQTPILDGALAPDGRTLALVRGGSGSDVVLTRLDSPVPAVRAVLTGVGLGKVAWSPDGRWLLVSWPAANQWVFIKIVGRPRIEAVSRVAQQFAATGSTSSSYPRLDGWCCTAAGTAR